MLQLNGNAGIRIPRSTRILWQIAAVFSLALPCLQADVFFTSMSPLHGLIGTRVTLTGTGFSPAANNSVTINGKPVSLARITSTNIEVVVSPGAESGAVALTVDGKTYTHSAPFRVERNVSGRFILPPRVDPAGYQIGSSSTLSSFAADGTFTTTVPLDDVAVVWGFRGTNDPLFASVVLPSTSQVSIDATNTAIALVVLSPLVGTRELSVLQPLLANLSALPELANLTEVIKSASTAGADYLIDSRYDAAMTNVVQKLLSTSISSQSVSSLDFKDGTPPNTYLKDLNPDALGYPATVRLKSTLDIPANDTNKVRFKLDKFGSPNALSARGNNPLDWIVELYRVDPAQFKNGRASVDALTAFDTPKLLGDEPFATGFVRASLASKKLDLLKMLSDALSDKVYAGVEDKPNEFVVARNAPGVYVSHAYSGNLWYGTSFFAATANQTGMLDRLNGNSAWSRALALNITLAALDIVSLAADPSNFVEKPERWAKLMFSVRLDVEKEIALHVAAGDMDAAAVFGVLKKATSATLKFTIKEAANAGLTKLGEGMLKTLFKGVDIFGKVSKAEQTLERGAALTTFSTFAVERSIFVVGTPFEPVIVGFKPTSGRAGDIVALSGYNFPESTSAVRVSFCTFPSTANPNLAMKLPAKVINASPNTISVMVPADWRSSFPDGRAFICVEDTNGVMTSTIGLQPPYREFFFTAPPIIYAANPSLVRSGGIFSVTGTNFGPEIIFRNRFVFDGNREVEAHHSSSSNVTTILPPLTEGPHTVTIKIGNETAAQTLNFTVQNPASAGYKNGITITVGKLDLSNAPDGQISLLEAMLIANGTLGRPVETHLPCESLPNDDPNHCPPQIREVDSIVGYNASAGNTGGAASRDTINIATKLKGGTITVAGGLPPLGNGDTYSFADIVVDGGGGASDGLLLDNTQGARVDHVVLRNFGGHGLHLRNGASGNSIGNVSVVACGGSGAFFDTEVNNNELRNLTVSNAVQHGLLLSGAKVQQNYIFYDLGLNNRLLSRLQNCGGWGLVLSNGANHNIILPGTIRNNARGGILVTGFDTDDNVIGPHGDPNYAPTLNDIYNNGGPGVYLTAGVNNNIISFLNPAGNQGDGILLEGPDCARNQVNGVVVGLDVYSQQVPVALPNQGSGIRLTRGAYQNLIGSQLPGGFYGRAVIAGNRDDGVLLEGPDTASNTVNRAHIGTLETFFQQVAIPNGLNGIHIRDGSHDNFLGAVHSYLDLHILASAKAAILIEGKGSDRNSVVGNQIGDNHEDNPVLSHSAQNNIGVHIKDGPKGNTIGYMGDHVEFNIGNDFFVFRFANVIANCKEAGILLENCGGALDANGRLVSPNVIQNNHIGEQDFGGNGPNTVGIKIINNAQGNIIGGPLAGQRNNIRFNLKAGIQMNRNVVSDPALRNQFLNNAIEFGGGPVLCAKLPAQDPLIGPTTGIGVLIDGNSAGNVFGESTANANVINQNCVGVWIEGSSDNSVSGAMINYNSVAGIVINKGQFNTIGGDAAADADFIFANGSGQPHDCGILISGGGDNIVQSAVIGDILQGNNGAGIYIVNSSFNQIGGDKRGNIIAANTGHGIYLSGAASRFNQIKNNGIGLNSKGLRAPNLKDGIRLDGGASANMIGGLADARLLNGALSIPTPNTIVNNLGAGVTVFGAGATGNSILNNSIYANAGLGIANVGGGNFEIPPPVQVTYDGTRIIGRVTDLAKTPVGSTIQVFSDAGAQGYLLRGEATVVTGGSWEIPDLLPPLPPLGSTLTMTATHGVDGSTSEFGTAAVTDIAFTVSRVGNETIVTSSPGALNSPLLRLAVGAVNAAVRVDSIELKTTGTMKSTDLTEIRLYQDVNNDGAVSAGDLLLAGPVPFPGAFNPIFLTLTNAVISANSSQHWLLAASVSAAATANAQFKASLDTATSISAHFVTPTPSTATPAGIFPITSPLFTVIGSTLAGPRFETIRGSTNGVFQMTLSGVPGQQFRIDASTNLIAWSPLTTLVISNGGTVFLDLAAPAFKKRFYRAVTP